jgi:DNA-binding transcriptional LysR family regulator
MALLRSAGLLRPFLAVARAGNLSAAARELSVSQPALTKSVRKLEQHCGVALFDRRARGMTLTPSGTALLAHARQIEAQCRVADGELGALARGEAGAIRVGAGPYWGNTVVPRAIARLHERLPRLEVGLDVGVNSVILPRLFAGELDLVVGALPDIGALPAGIERRDFFNIQLRVVAGRHHPLHARKRVSAAELAEFPWVLYQHDRDVMDRLAEILQRGGAPKPPIRVETTSLLAVMQLLRAGPYLACMADALLRAAPEPDIAIVPYPRGVWSFPSGALFHVSVRDFAPIRTLLEILSREAGAAASERTARRRKR